jgi:hypothetical protein
MSAKTLERLTMIFGTPTAYDGRFCVWCQHTPYDVRDIARQLRVAPDAVVSALPEFKPVKRGRAQIEEPAE